MSYTKFKTVNFGINKAGLSTVGYKLINSLLVAGSRITAGVLILPASGCYGANVSITDGFIGFIQWDTGESIPVYAIEEVAPYFDEYGDVAASSRATSAGVLSTLNGAHGTGAWDQGTLVQDIASALTAEHGSGAWNGIGFGTYSTTINVQTTGAIGISGVGVTIKNSTSTTILLVGSTDTNGQVTYNLNAGTYKVLLSSSALYQTLPEQTLVVSANGSVTYILTALTLSVPVLPNLCRIHFYTSQLAGVVEEGIVFQFSLTAKKSMEVGGYFIKVTDVVEGTTDALGHGFVDIIRSQSLEPDFDIDTATVRVVCTAYKIDSTTTVPNVSAVNLSDLIP